MGYQPHYVATPYEITHPAGLGKRSGRGDSGERPGIQLARVSTWAPTGKAPSLPVLVRRGGNTSSNMAPCTMSCRPRRPGAVHGKARPRRSSCLQRGFGLARTCRQQPGGSGEERKAAFVAVTTHPAVGPDLPEVVAGQQRWNHLGRYRRAIAHSRGFTNRGKQVCLHPPCGRRGRGRGDTTCSAGLGLAPWRNV